MSSRLLIFFKRKNTFDPLSFNYESDSDSYWRYDLRDILVFYLNIWWDLILILFYLYNLNVWGGRPSEINTNQFRVKAYVLQLLGGFNMINRMERVKQSLKNHYVLSDKVFNDIKILGKTLLNTEVNKKNKNLDNKDSFLSDVFGSFGNKVELSSEVTTNLEKIILGAKPQIIEDPFEDLYNISHKKTFTSSQSDEVNLFESNQEFILNYHLNILLVFLLGLEMLINLVYNIILKNLESNSLKRILFLSIENYVNIVWYYNENFKNLEGIDIPKDFPKSFDQKIINSFTLIFSGLKNW